MSKTGIFFDFDGTLFYGTTDINYYAINMALEDMGRSPVSRDVANSTVGDRLIDACKRILQTQKEGGQKGSYPQKHQKTVCQNLFCPF